MNHEIASNPLHYLLLVLAVWLGGCSPARMTESRALPPVNHCTADETTGLAQLEGCTVVTGDVHVEQTGLTNLNKLSALRSISGTLFVVGNPELVSLQGLDELETVGNLRIVNNPKLEDLAALSSLETVRHISIVGNQKLETLDGVDSVAHLDTLEIRGNGLTRMAGFGGLVTAQRVVIRNNPRLIYLSGLNQLAFVEDLVIRQNPRLAPTPGLLKNLQSVDAGALVVRGSVVVDYHLLSNVDRGPISPLHPISANAVTTRRVD